MTTWNILYRGSLSSCNYACAYCPFAKTANTRAELRQDERELTRFADWMTTRRERLGLLITPWGEALTHRYYRRELVRLSHFPHIYRVSIQTNLSAPVEDLAEADRDTLALWTTFHPSQTSLERFLARVHGLESLGLRFSVGVVGLPEQYAAIEELRQRLSARVYLWINAFKRHDYSPAEIARLKAVDPHFELNLRSYASLGKPCRAGETSFTVDGRGDVRRCHLLPQVLGNVYGTNFPSCLQARNCTAERCGCHIGYVHRPELQLDRLFGDGLLERIPAAYRS